MVYVVDFGLRNYFAEIWIPVCLIEDPIMIENAKILDKELEELCTNIGATEMCYITSNLEEANAIRAKAIELVLTYFPTIGADCMQYDFQITEL